jgi:dipeptidyl aminopeptidase/acylaminoacyl peptidase
LYVLGQELGETGYDFVARNTGVWAASVADLPVTEPRLLTDIEHVDYGDVHSTLVTDGEGVLAFARVRGAGQLHRVTADGTVDIVSEGHRVITGAAVADGKIVVSYTDPTTPGEIAVIAGEDLRTLTNLAAGLRERTTITKQVEFEATSKDGYPVHGWIFKPQGEGPHPVLLNIHGGPFADYQWAYFDEAQAYTAAGYAVVQCNPRGSAGYGREHGVAIRQAMGTLDMDDVLSFFEQAVAANPELDGERAGVLGGSYGGYLTSWIIGHDDRFKGAIVERGFLEPFSFVGTSDIGSFFAGEYTGTDPDHVLTQSPMAVAHNVTTPTLVLHSEEDLRCPLEQAQQYYAALKRAGVDTEFLVFPGESHELSRTGTPWHRMQRFDAILEWWSRHLPVA